MSVKKIKSATEQPKTNPMESLFARLFVASKNPSEHMASAWIYAASPKTKAFESTENTGKWCVFRSGEQVDETWAAIEKACKSNKLAVAKVASAMSSKNFGGNHVICVYTEDYKNKKEVDRVRKVLLDLGCTEPLAYKRDIDTINGIYGTEEEWFYKDDGFSASTTQAKKKKKTA